MFFPIFPIDLLDLQCSRLYRSDKNLIIFIEIPKIMGIIEKNLHGLITKYIYHYSMF